MADHAQDIFGWIQEIPVVTRAYLAGALAVTTACYLDLVSPLTLYYNLDLILHKGQYWRLLTSFLFFGTFSLDFVFHMYFVVRYCRLLEEGTFRGRTADFVFMLIYGATLMLACTALFSIFSRIKFLGHPLSFMMVYLWSRDPDNADVHMSFFGVLQFTAPYLPWALLGFSLLIGNPVEMDLLGIAVGHTYYFLDQVYPQVAQIRNWRIKRVLCTPSFLHHIFSTEQAFAFLNARIVAAAPLNGVQNEPHHPHQD